MQWFIVFITLLACGCTPQPQASTAPSAIPPPLQPPLVIHATGIGGHMAIDDHLVAGLKDGFQEAGEQAEFQIDDWTGPDRGLIALGQVQRHQEQSTLLSQRIADAVHADPRRRIIITSHSAGCGIAVWALEKLPSDVKIDQLVMMQSALSPTYDLSKALSHVKHAYSFYSANDEAVLGAGTRMMGTVDRVHTDAAGRVGYTRPELADAKQYAKLDQFPYEDSWMKYDDIGDHIGPMTYPFARFMIAPLLLNGKLPENAVSKE
jgi:hypothetical protein